MKKIIIILTLIVAFLIYNNINNSNDGNVKNRSMAHFYVENEKIYIVDDYDNNKKIKEIFKKMAILDIKSCI